MSSFIIVLNVWLAIYNFLFIKDIIFCVLISLCLSIKYLQCIKRQINTFPLLTIFNYKCLYMNCLMFMHCLLLVLKNNMGQRTHIFGCRGRLKYLKINNRVPSTDKHINLADSFRKELSLSYIP